MDEPKRSAAAASGYLIPIALGLLLVGYVWPEHGTQGPVTVTYSRLLGFRIEGAPLPVRQVAGTIVANLPWLAVLLASLRPMAPNGRSFVFGAAGLFGLAEMLQLITTALFGQLIGVSTLWLGAGSLLLSIAALGGFDRGGEPEIRETEGGRA